MKTLIRLRRELSGLRSYDAPEFGREGKIRLDLNENTSGCPASVRRALACLSAKSIAMYPDYTGPAKRLARYFGVRPDQLILSNGADDALRVVFDAFVDRGSKVLFCEPTFPMYRYYAELFGAKIIAPRYSREITFPIDSVLRALERSPRLAIFANPNNPTGELLGRKTLERIISASRQTAVVIDEAYFEFSDASVLPWLRKNPNLFIVRTFSKAAGLAGLRLGALLGNSDSMRVMRKAVLPFAVNLAALAAADAAVRDQRSIRRYVRETTRLRDHFASQLRDRHVRVFPSAGNFLLADFGGSGQRLFSALERTGILIRPRTKDIGLGFARISIGTRNEMNTLLSEIDRHLHRINPHA
jgi:histidinol-phosphate aminotransferase